VVRTISLGKSTRQGTFCCAITAKLYVMDNDSAYWPKHGTRGLKKSRRPGCNTWAVMAQIDGTKV
jgi:hypothetical protein